MINSLSLEFAVSFMIACTATSTGMIDMILYVHLLGENLNCEPSTCHQSHGEWSN